MYPKGRHCDFNQFNDTLKKNKNQNSKTQKKFAARVGIHFSLSITNVPILEEF